MTRAFWLDLAQRTGVAAILAFAGVLLASAGTGIDLSTVHAAEIAAAAAALRVIIGLLSSLYGDPNSAAVISKRKPGRHTRKGASYTVTRRRIPEVKVPGKPLGRHVEHDSRSLNYLVKPNCKHRNASVRWAREIPVLDQGNLGSCTGNAGTGALGTEPAFDTLTGRHLTLDETYAKALYSDAEIVDGGKGLPAEDNGSSGLSVAKVLKARGVIASYLHATSVAAAKTAIQSGPFIVGSDWHTGMDNPNTAGLVVATGPIRGGHEYECIGYDAASDLWEFVNSWGTSYGVGGHFFYSSATFAQLLAAQGDITVFTPIAAPIPTPPAPTPTPTPTPTPVPVGVVVDDPVLVAKISGIAVKDGMSPHDFLAKRLHALYKI